MMTLDKVMVLCRKLNSCLSRARKTLVCAYVIEYICTFTVSESTGNSNQK